MLVLTNVALAYQQNLVRSQGLENQLSYSYGYDRGYFDYENDNGKNSHLARNCYNRETKSGCSQFSTDEVYSAYWDKGNYLLGYLRGYDDAKQGNDIDVEVTAVMDSYNAQISEADDSTVTKTVSITTTSSSESSTVKTKATIGDVDLTMAVSDIAFDFGYYDAKNGLGSHPTKAIDDLKTINTEEANDVVNRLRDERGVFIMYYKKGYDSYDGTTTVAETEDYDDISVSPTQLSSSEKETLGEELGCKNAEFDKKYNKGKRFLNIFRYDGMIPPYPYTTTDVKLAIAARGSYITGYKGCY